MRRDSILHDSQFMEHEPGPRGSPQLPQDPPGALVWRGFSPPTAKVESCCSSCLPSHLGHAGFCCPRTMVSKWWSHSRQTYSNIGINGCSVRISTTPYYKACSQVPV